MEAVSRQKSNKRNIKENVSDKFIDKLIQIEEPLAKQLLLAFLWSGGVFLALGLVTAILWACLVMVAIFVPRIKTFNQMFLESPYGIRSQTINFLAASIWGVAPFMVWQAGSGQYDFLAVTMLGIGFLQVISKYRSEPIPAVLVAIPYLMMIGWFLYQMRMSEVFVVSVIVTTAYLIALFGFVWAGRHSKMAIVKYKQEQDKIKEELKQALLAAEQANSAKSAFLANMSHELRTPLNGILGLTDVLLSDDLTSSQKRKITLIKDSGETLLALLNDILDLSKIEADEIEVESLTFNLDEFLQKAYSFWKPVADKKNINLQFQKQKNLPPNLVSDPMRIRQCLNNLLSNALKFTPVNGNIIVTITGRELNGDLALLISVKDDGVGISEDNITKLFTPFKQSDQSTTRQFGGTGLGLTITRKLCRLMGGNVNVQSVLGQGSVFSMVIKAGIGEQIAEKPENAQLEIASNINFNGVKCLVVEDNEVNMEVLLIMLEDFGMDVVVARDGKQAIERLESQNIDVVLMDLQMPVMGGMEATAQIRQSNEPYANIPIIAMTANAMNGDRDKCLQNGMNEYVSKPLGKNDLARVFNIVLNNAKISAGQNKKPA